MSTTNLPAFETERLWLRGLRREDAEDLHALFSDEVAMRYWHALPTTNLADSTEAVAAMLRSDPTWVFGTHGEDAVIGHLGFVGAPVPGRVAGFGYGLRRDRWGRGLTVEAARAVLEHGFGSLGISGAELWIHRDNAQSVRVAEKLGARLRNETMLGYGTGPSPSLIYGLTAERWRGEPEPLPVHYSVEPVLQVADVRAAADWWRDVLGFRVGFLYGDPPTHAGITSGWTGGVGVQLSRAGQPMPGGGSTYVHASDLDAVWARVQASGTTVLSPPTTFPWGMREIEVADADGNRVRVGCTAPRDP